MAKGISATSRTLKGLREEGCVCGMVERFLHHVGKFGIRQDLFGIIDIIALDTRTKLVRGVQSTTGAQYAEHYRKLTEEKRFESLLWLSMSGTTLELWAWRKLKVKKGGKAMHWVPRITVITPQMIHEADNSLDFLG